MTSPSRLGYCLLAAAAVAALIGAACASQPAPNCPVAVSNPIFGYPNFWASYTLQAGTGDCASLKGEEVGFQKYTAPGDNVHATLAVRGYQLGGRINGEFGFEHYTPRVDSSDPDGLKVNSLGPMTPFPKNDLCTLTGELSVAEQHFDVANYDVGDGGLGTLPAETISYQWSNVEFINTPNIPGTAFKASLKYRIDSCQATYAVEGIWPLVRCKTDLDCSAYAQPDAGESELGFPQRRFTGSGINPDFEVRCDTDPTVVALLDDWTAYRGDFTPTLEAYQGAGACVLTHGYDALKAANIK